MPTLTIGMAVYDDMIGVLDTCQDLRIHHADAMRDVEIVVVDNHPDSEHGGDTKKFVEGYCHIGTAGAKYVPMPEAQGTTQPRERVFREASGDFVMCVDSHIKLMPDALARLMRWLDDNPSCDDLWQGPMVYDCLDAISTDMLDVWRGGMRGVWNCDERGVDPDADPFEIWGQGLGLFGCRRESWPGFHPDFREFGGEEGYIHEKFRRLGRKAICLPFLRWWHRFWQPGDQGRKYRRTTWGMARNYVLGHQELGEPLDRAHEHLVRQHRSVSQAQWEELLAGAKDASVPILAEPEPSVGPDAIARLYDAIAADGHAEMVRNLAASRQHVTIVGCGDSLYRMALAAAASRPRFLHVYSLGPCDLSVLHAAVKQSPGCNGRRIDQLQTTMVPAGVVMPQIEETDILIAPVNVAGAAERSVMSRIMTPGQAILPGRWKFVGLRHGFYLWESA